jgi:hypothetical protein
MTPEEIKELRKRAHHFVSYDISRFADMSQHEMQQFIAGTFLPTDDQLVRLANRLQMRAFPS